MCGRTGKGKGHKCKALCVCLVFLRVFMHKQSAFVPAHRENYRAAHSILVSICPFLSSAIREPVAVGYSKGL